MDIRGTWISKIQDEKNGSKSITIVDMLDDETGIGPDGLKISVLELHSKYVKSDPFGSLGMNQELAAFVQKENIVTTPIDEPKAATATIAKNIQQIAYISEKDDSPEYKLYNAMLLIGTTPSTINVNTTIELPINIDLIKNLALSMESLNKEKFIKLMIEDSTESILKNIANSIFENISV